MDLMRTFCQEQIPGTFEHEVLTSYMNEKMQKVHEKKKKKPEAESPQPTEDIPDFNASYSNDHALRECWVSLGKNTYSALVDTGASHNLISTKVLQSLNRRDYTFTARKVNMNTPGGVLVNNIIGSITTNIELVTTEGKLEKLPCKFLVAKKLGEYQVVLGNILLNDEKLNPVLTCRTLGLYINKEYVYIPFHRSLRAGFHRFGMTMEELCIKPGEAVMIDILINEVDHETTVYMEAALDPTETGVEVTPCINNITRIPRSNFGQTTVIIKNKETENKIIPRGSHMVVAQYKNREHTISTTELNNMMSDGHIPEHLDDYIKLFKKRTKKRNQRKVRFENQNTGQKKPHDEPDYEVNNMEKWEAECPEIILPSDAEQIFDEEHLLHGETYLPDPSNEDKEDTIEDGDFKQCTPEERDKILSVLKDFKDNIAKNKLDLGHTDYVTHLIQVNPLKKLIPQRQRHQNNSKQEYADHALEKWLQMGVISECPYPKHKSNLCLVPRIVDPQNVPERTRAGVYHRKINNEKIPVFRLTVDLRDLNRVTINDQAVNTIRPDDLIAKLSGKRITAMDISNGYYNISLSHSSRPYTAFYHRQKIYMFNRLTQGLVGAPYSFQIFMNKLFSQEKYNDALALLSPEDRKRVMHIKGFHEFVFVYMDDVFLASNLEDIDTHTVLLRLAMLAIKFANVKLGIKKCTFYATSVKVLGVNINSTQATTSLDKIKASSILSWPRPASLAELQSRLCSLGYFARYMPFIRNAMQPLYVMLRGDSFYWDDICEKAWQTLKALILADIRLTIPEPHHQLIMCVDASKGAINQVLFSIDDQGQFRVVSTNSKILSSLDFLKAMHYKESLSLAMGFRTYYPYLSASTKPPLIFCDARNLQFLNRTKQHSIFSNNLSNYLAKMCQIFKYNVYSIPSELNVLADMFSRSFAQNRFISEGKYTLSKEQALTLPPLPEEYCFNSDTLYKYLTGTLLPEKEDRGNRGRSAPKPIQTIWHKYNGLTPEHAYSTAIVLLKQICKKISQEDLNNAKLFHCSQYHTETVDQFLSTPERREPVISPEECAMVLTAIGMESKAGNRKLTEIIMDILDKTMEIPDTKVKTKAKNCLVEIFRTNRKTSEIPEISNELTNLVGPEHLKKSLLDLIKEEVSFRYCQHAIEKDIIAPDIPEGWKETEEMVSGRLSLEYEKIMEQHDKQEAAQLFHIPLTPLGEAVDQYKLENGRLEIERKVPLMTVFYKLYGPHAPARGYEGDAGVDLRLQESVTLMPNERKMVDLGISLAIPGQAVGILKSVLGN